MAGLVAGRLDSEGPHCVHRGSIKPNNWTNPKVGPPPTGGSSRQLSGCCLSLWKLKVTMEQHHNCRPVGRGAGNRDETTDGTRDGYERGIIEFIRRWHRFGGGSARDIFVEFGLAEHEFFRRTLELVQTGPF